MTERADGPVRVGVDLVAVDDVAASIDRFGDRYLGRLFTDHERACCTTGGHVRVDGLAARFAAKEAVVKVLRPAAGAARPPWTSIEVRRQADGSCRLALHGSAAELAARDGLVSWSVSLTHEGEMAAAVVAATTEGWTA